MKDFPLSFYKKLFHSLDNNAVLMRVEEDGSYNPVWCSEEFTEMMEGTQEDFIRLESGGSMRTIHPDDREQIAYLFRHHVTKNGTNSVTVRKRTVKGHEIWVKIHYAFIEEGGVQYAYCLYTDVTEIRQSQARTQAVYQGLVDQFNAMSEDSLTVYRVNLSRGIIEEVRGRDLYPEDRAGERVENSVRVRRESFLVAGQRERFEEVYHPAALLEHSYSGDGPTVYTGYCRRASGRQCFVKYSITASIDPISGNVILFGVETEANAEMVGQVLNEKILASQYDMVSYIVNGYYGIAIGDAANIKKGNIFPKRRNGTYMDYITEQVIPAADEAEHDKQALLQALLPETVARELRDKESYTVEVGCSIDGEHFDKRFIFYLADRESAFYILLKADVTEVLRQQRAQNDLLASALQEAKQASVAKTAFLSSMSHEIRTPMNAIIGLDSIALKDPDLPPRTREYLEKIGTSAQHLLSLINAILDMSRIESGRMVLRQEEFSFREMLEQINTMIDGQCTDKGLTYDSRLIGTVDEFYIGDVMKLKQVLINILGNAVKFTPSGGTVSFYVERTARFEDKTTLHFTVRDTGIGMDEKFLPRIFDAFSQEDENKANKYGSTGLGMAITKSIVEMMNGSISVESKKGEGTTFYVNVTLRDGEKKLRDAGKLAPQELRVLVVDDDPVACEHAQLVLEEVGIAADTCQSGQEALRLIELRHARRDAYNLILVDWKMPEEDGMAVTRRIRQLYHGESAIIILTAYSWEDVMDEAVQAGVDSFMPKPLFASTVLQEFRQALERRAGKTEGEARKADLTGRHLLLAEDIAINAEILRELLEMRGITSDHAENGQIAVEMFARSAPGDYAAVLMDVRMPVMDGLQAAAAIRAMDRPDAARIPIIALTANAFDEDVQRSLQVGMNAHLSKPVEPERLFQTLETLIRDELD